MVIGSCLSQVTLTTRTATRITREVWKKPGNRHERFWKINWNSWQLWRRPVERNMCWNSKSCYMWSKMKKSWLFFWAARRKFPVQRFSSKYSWCPYTCMDSTVSIRWWALWNLFCCTLWMFHCHWVRVLVNNCNVLVSHQIQICEWSWRINVERMISLVLDR